MVFSPSSSEDISDSIEERLRGRISKLTNFVSSSFNRVFLSVFAEELYDYEIRILAAQLSGWVDYAGGPIDQSDLSELGIEEFDDLERLNRYMLDVHLDNIASLVGLNRDIGSKATGEIRVQVFDQNTRVPDGMKVSTPPDFDGDKLQFEVDIDDPYVTPADQGNSDFVDVSIIAENEGLDYDVGSGRITRLPSPPPGIEGVNNPAATTGGQDKESNDELRERIKNAVFETSGGGTTDGIRGFVLGNVEGTTDVFVDEFFNATPVYVDVIVDGGTRSDALDAIEESRPAGIRHNLVRPQTYNVAVEVELRGTDIDRLKVQDAIEDYIVGLDLGDDYVQDVLIQRVLNSDQNIENILNINVRIVEVLNDRKVFSAGQDKYDLDESPLGVVEGESHHFVSDKDVYQIGADPVDASSVTLTATVNGSTQTLTGGGTDYTVTDSNGDGMLNAIDFSGGSTTPDNETSFTIDYETVTQNSETFTYDGSDDYELTFQPALAGDSSVSDASGDTYTLGTDYDIVDTTGNTEKDTFRWLSGGSTPDSSEDFTVTHEVDVGSINEVVGELNGTENHTFVEETDYNEFDSTGDTKTDQIDWSLGGDDPDDGTPFSIDASVEKSIPNDYFVSQREKVSPFVDKIEVKTYD